jgi:peptide/nickel transport system substrate-binding protein
LDAQVTSRRLAPVVLLVAFLLLMAYVPVPRGASPTIITLSRTGFTDVANLNPFSPEGVYGIYVELYLPFAANAFPPSPEVVPVLAQGWSHSANYSQWTLNLKQGLKWDDGTPLNATDLYYSLQLTNNTFVQGPFDAHSFKILNSTAVRVSFSAPDYHFVEVGLGSTGIEIVPYHAFSKQSNITAFANLQNIVADGPYVLYNYAEGTNPMVFQANPYFFGGKPQIDEAAVYLFSSFSSAINTYDSGQLDALWSNGAYSTVKPLASVQGSTLVQSVPATTLVALMNNWRYPLNTTAFRQALAYATDRVQINNLLNGPFASSSEVPWDMLLPQYNKWLGFSGDGPVSYSTNLTTASNLLASMGLNNVGGNLQYANGTQVSLNIIFNGGSADAGSVATLLQEQWSKLGISVTVTSESSSNEAALATTDQGWQVDVSSNAPMGPVQGPGILAEQSGWQVTDPTTGVNVTLSPNYIGNVTLAEQYPTNSTDFNTYAGSAVTVFAKTVPMIPLYDEFNWVAVNNNFFWGSPTQHTGIYNPQTVASQILWYETMALMHPLAASTTSSSSHSTTSSTQSMTAPTTTSSSMTSPSSAPSTNDYYLYAAVIVLVVVVIAALALSRSRRGHKAT